MKLNFQCTQCGECCRHIGNIPALRKYDSGNGVCKFLDNKNNLCTIYHERPLICNVAAVYDEYFSQVYDEEDFLRINYKVCRLLQESKE